MSDNFLFSILHVLEQWSQEQQYYHQGTCEECQILSVYHRPTDSETLEMESRNKC